MNNISKILEDLIWNLLWYKNSYWIMDSIPGLFSNQLIESLKSSSISFYLEQEYEKYI